MNRHSTESLVERYLNQPGIESERLEFKAKEKVETTKQRRELVKILTAMANTRGGTVIVGVGRDERDSIVQSFDNQSEYKRDLYHVAQDNTEPALSDLLTIDFDQIPLEATVLRIDIDQAETFPIKFNVGGNDGYVAYHRVGDTTKRMNADDGVRFAEDRFHDPRNKSLFRTEHVSINSPNNTNPPSSDRPGQRVITNTSRDYQIVFGPGVNYGGYEKSVVFDIETTVGINLKDDVSAVKSILDAAEKHLNLDLVREFGYSVKQGSRTLLGKHVDHFYQDLRQLETVVANMLDGHPEDVSDDITHIDSFRPTVVAYSNSNVGTFWLKLEWREHLQQFIRPKCGILLGELPFNDEPLQSFFNEVNADPDVYQQHTGLQELTLKGQIQLQNPQPIKLEPTTDFVGHLLAPNPFYRQAEVLQQQVDEPLPSHFLEGVCSITHLPLFNQGPELDGDEDVMLKYIDVTCHRLTWPTLFLDAMCIPESS